MDTQTEIIIKPKKKYQCQIEAMNRYRQTDKGKIAIRKLQKKANDKRQQQLIEYRQQAVLLKELLEKQNKIELIN